MATLEDVICNAYTVIEFDKNFCEYYNADREDRSYETCLSDWNTCLSDYERVKPYLNDHKIHSVQMLVMGEF